MSDEVEKKEAVHDYVDDYKKFAFKDGMLKMAIAFILGASFTKVVTAISESLIMPILNFLLSKTGSNWREWIWTPATGLELEIGVFLGAMIDFLLISIVLFVMYRLMLTMLEEADEARVTIRRRLGQIWCTIFPWKLVKRNKE